MAFRLPQIGDWYIDRGSGMHFEVVAIDDSARTIEMQCVDGELSEMDFESWGEMDIESAAPPEDWSAAYELGRDDDPWGDSFESDNDPLTSLESDIFEGSDEHY